MTADDLARAIMQGWNHKTPIFIAVGAERREVTGFDVVIEARPVDGLSNPQPAQSGLPFLVLRFDGDGKAHCG